MARVVIRPKARRELQQVVVYLMENAGPEVARRFRRAATETFQSLAAMPAIAVDQSRGCAQDVSTRGCGWRVYDLQHWREQVSPGHVYRL